MLTWGPGARCGCSAPERWLELLGFVFYFILTGSDLNCTSPTWHVAARPGSADLEVLPLGPSAVLSLLLEPHLRGVCTECLAAGRGCLRGDAGPGAS